MITLTDDEQRTALRAARYALVSIKRRREQGGEGHTENVDTKPIERVIAVLEHKNDNGMWRCLCLNPWRHPTCTVCPTCGAACPS